MEKDEKLGIKISSLSPSVYPLIDIKVEGEANLFVKDVIPWAHFSSVVFLLTLVCCFVFLSEECLQEGISEVEACSSLKASTSGQFKGSGKKQH